MNNRGPIKKSIKLLETWAENKEFLLIKRKTHNEIRMNYI